MKIINTLDPSIKPPVSILVYGMGGVGKTTFVSTAPKPILADCENGAKFFGLRGISLDKVNIESWEDIRTFASIISKNKDYETVAIDPIGKLMDKLITETKKQGSRQYVAGNNLTMAGWGYVKEKMREVLDFFISSGKNVILIAHVEEKTDTDSLIRRPKIATKIAEEVINMVDVTAWMTRVTDPETQEAKRVLLVSETDERYVAKDRTGQLGNVVEPNFSKIVSAIQGTESFSWSKKEDVKHDTKEVEQEQELDEKITIEEINYDEIDSELNK